MYVCTSVAEGGSPSGGHPEGHQSRGKQLFRGWVYACACAVLLQVEKIKTARAALQAAIDDNDVPWLLAILHAWWYMCT